MRLVITDPNCVLTWVLPARCVLDLGLQQAEAIRLCGSLTIDICFQTLLENVQFTLKFALMTHSLTFIPLFANYQNYQEDRGGIRTQITRTQTATFVAILGRALFRAHIFAISIRAFWTLFELRDQAQR